MRLEVSTPIIVDMNETDGDPSRSVAAPHSAAAPLPSHTIAHPLVGAILGGVLLGLSDLLAQNTLPYPWANLANSAAVWALGAFVIGAWSRGRLRSTAAAGMVLLLVAVETYYIAAVAFLHDSVTALWSETTALWLVLAVFVGQIFAVAGSLIHSRRPGIRFAAAGFAGSIFIVEAIARLTRSPGGNSSGHEIHTALIEIALAVVVWLVLLAATLTRRARPES